MAALSLLVLAMLHSPSLEPAPSVGNLTCEYVARPLAVESAAPRLGWVTRYSGKNWRQSAYRILVASSPERLAHDEGDLWDSGRVATDASIQIPYDGKTLRPRQACYWKVRVWDGSGESPWSKPAEWEMGLLDEASWQGGRWIGGDPGSTAAPYLRRGFTVEGKVVRARLYASGLGYAELHLNGKKVGETTERDPGYTNFDKRVLYVAHDVTSDLKRGANSLGAILGTGWYDVHDLATWRFEKAPWRGRPRLKLALFIDYADGHTQAVGSDASWKTASGPIVFDGIYTGEMYDARFEMPGWDKPGFDDHSWKPATEAPAPKGVMTARICPPVAITQTIKPVAIEEPKPGVYIVDFGQNFSGHARLHVEGPEGTEITMRYSERIGPDGMIERSQIEQFMTKETPPQPFQTDRYVCKGQGRETWEQRFSYSGFRYMEVTGFPGKPTLDHFEGRFAHTDFESAGSFECSDATLNKIQRATRYSYLSNAQSIPTDCPQREKNGWTGDAQLAAEAGLMNFQSASFYTKWLDDFSDDQQPDGRVSVIVPSGGWGYGACHPAWDSAFPIVAEDLYDYCGDRRILERHYDKLRNYVDYVASQTKGGLVPFDSLGDWVPWKTETPSQLTSTIFLCIDARIVAKIATMTGKEEDARRYADLAETTRAAFVRKFFEPTIPAESQTALAMAIYFKMLPPDLSKKALDALVQNVETQGHIDTGILGAKFILRALSEGGRSDLAFKLVARKEQPSWAWWIEQGATTLWEDWKGESSLNHIMFGDVSNWFIQWIAGIGLDPAAPAFKHILIHPQPVGGLTWAKATHESPYGPISSSWRRNGSKFHLDVSIPANATATVRLPDGKTTEVGSGTYSFDCAIPT
ncbi:MAG TPA: family 78 glycoside hydrolase catalytic domain [Fimbriimonadaceae bacterium]|nr:family 78 glycoside hydrolase catalytic domain [Fimbriimonadaceae bacterium]